MGTALQTQNPRVSGVLASILHEAPVGLCRARSRRWTNRMREREICIHRFGTRKTYTMRWKEGQRRRAEYVDLVMGQCASVTIRYCVRAHCSRLFFLRARHVPRWHPWVLGTFGYLPSHAEDRGEKKIARISSRVVADCENNPFEICYRVERRICFARESVKSPSIHRRWIIG